MRSRSLSLGLWAALGGALLVLAALPVLTTTIPPLVDYINHLARVHIIAAGGRDPLLAQYYDVAWRPIPNLAIDGLVPPLVPALGLFAAGKAFLLATMALLAIGPHAVHYALFRRLSLGPFLALLFLYNASFSGGLVNYLFGVGLAVWGIAFWIGLARAPAALRAAVSSAFIVVLWFSHLAAAGLYGVSIAAIELWRARSGWASYRTRLAANLATLLLPAVLALALYALEPRSEIVEATRWTVMGKLRGIAWTLEGEPRYRLAEVAAAAAVLALGAAIAWRRGLVRLDPAGIVLAMVAMAVFLAMPSDIAGGSGVDSRLPLGFLFVLIGFIEWRLDDPRRSAGFAAALAMLLVARVVIVDQVWRGMTVDTDEIMQSAGAVAPGSRILVVQGEGPRDPNTDWLYYLPCLMTIERSSLVSVLFSDPAQQSLEVKPPYRATTGGYNDDPPRVSEWLEPPARSPSAPSGRIYWVDWQRNYDYVYLIGNVGDREPALPASLAERYRGHRFRLYAVERH